MQNYLFFDNASTTKCCLAAAELLSRYACQDFGNPSSSHTYGQMAARAIRDSRQYFAQIFNVKPDQVIFTGSGSESDNMAIYGIAMEVLARRVAKKTPASDAPPRVLVSAIEHPAVRKTAQSLSSLGFDVQLIPVDAHAQIQKYKFLELLTPETVLVSIQQVNNIVGSVLPVEELAQLTKERAPDAVFHTDAVQAFGKVKTPAAPSSIDLVSISAHKVHGPKGIGALIVLNPKLLKSGLRPLVWGGEQEGGFRSGTQNPGMIAGFKAAAEEMLQTRDRFNEHASKLRERMKKALNERSLPVTWNSPENGAPHIVSLSIPGFPSGPLAKLLEERRCLVSTGSACSSQKAEPDPVLSAMGLAPAVHTSAIRISFSLENSLEDVDHLVQALDESITLMQKLLGCGPKKIK